jgi:TatD DNase family protein
MFDSHAHLDDDRFDKDRQEAINRAWEAGLTGIINVGADMESSARSIELAEACDTIFASVGMHPHDSKDMKETDYLQLKRWAAHPKVVAIGEIGLDYHYDHSPRPVQQEVFVRQLDVAREMGKPVIIHEREAHADMLALVKSAGQGLTGVFHCFSGSLETAREAIKLGFYISLAGPVTFSNSVKAKQVAAGVPLDRLLIETDSPYLTPHPLRGKRNEPAFVRHVAEEVARLREISIEEVTAATTANVKRLFQIP